MESKKVYLDNNATTMLDPQAKELMESYFAKNMAIQTPCIVLAQKHT